MANDMEFDMFAQYGFGKAALAKIKPEDPDFRLYAAGWIGKAGERNVMQVTGAVFRRVTRGANKGKLSILVRGTEKTVQVLPSEMKAYESSPAA